MKYKTIVLITFVVFAVALAVVVGKRLSAEAMAVIVGVVAGVAASIPTSLIVVWAATRGRAVETRVVEAPRAEPIEPRIIVVQSPAPQPPQPVAALQSGYGQFPQPAGMAMPYPVEPRRFTVIGGEAEDEVG